MSLGFKKKRIKINDFLACFWPFGNNKYSYLGYVYWSKKSPEYSLIMSFIKDLDKIVKPWWCPRFFLRLTHLLGNDNSIARVRNWTIHRLQQKITKGIMITDLKWKFGTFRIYGYFTDEIENLADRYCEILDNKYGKQNLY